jgi:Cdc6-like AAA superfamily ATPase
MVLAIDAVHGSHFTGNHGADTPNEDFISNFNIDINRALKNNALLAIFAYGQTGSGKTYTMNQVADYLCKEIPYDTLDVKLTCIIKLI